MPSIDLDDHTYEMVRFAARVSGLTESETIARAVRAFAGQHPEPPVQRDPWDPVPLYGLYEGTRVEGVYVPATRRVTVTSEPLPGTSFKSPSGAARAVVAALNPSRAATQSNGWRFWHIAETHQRLEVLR